MELSTVAELQVLLEGVPLPVETPSLIRYAAHEGATASQIGLLSRLPQERWDTIDDVAERLVRVQPRREHGEPPEPEEEAGAPPGGDTYTQQHPESGAVRDLDSVNAG